MTIDRFQQGGVTVHLDAENPWPGLAAYDESLADYFCGRESETTELLRLIQTSPLTTLYGKSGLGKSSLLQAGLFPLLRKQHFLPIYLRLDFSEQIKLSPLEQIAQRFKDEITLAGADCTPQEPGESLWQYLHRDGFEIWSSDNFLYTPVLVFDQFEELFSQSGKDVGRIQTIFDDLTDLIENRIPADLASDSAQSKRSQLNLFSHGYRIVLSFREDFLADIKTLEPKIPSLLRNYLRLDAMTPESAVAVVDQAGSSVVEPGVAPFIVDFVGGYATGGKNIDSAKATIEPVLLSLFCYQLNRRRGANKIDQALVDASGQDILDSFYQEALADDEVKSPPEVSVFIEDYLVQGERYRGSYPKNEAINEGFISEVQLNSLTNRHRLLRVVQYADAARIELIHDCLVSVVCKARDLRHFKAQQAELERDIREQEKRAYSRHLIKLQRTLISLGIVVAVVFAYGFYQQKQAASARRAMAYAAIGGSYQTFAKNDKGLSLQLAIQALSLARLNKDDNALERAENIFRRALNHPLEFTIKLDEKPTSITFNVDGNYLYAASGKKLTKWDAHTGAEDFFKSPEFLGKIQQIIFNPDGSSLIAGDDIGNIWLLNPENGEEITPKQMHHGEYLYSMALNNEGLLATTDAGNGRVFFWDTVTGDKLGELPLDNDHGRWVSELAFNSKNHLLAIGEVSLGKTTAWSVIKSPSGGLIIKKAYRLPKMLIDSLEFSMDGRLLVTGDRDNRVNVWDAKSGNHLNALNGHVDQITKVAISPDVTRIASGSYDGNINLWDVESGRLLFLLSGHNASIEDLIFSPDNKQLASAAKDKKVLVWNAAAHSDAVFAVAFSPDGLRFATGSGDNTIKVWETASRKLVTTLTGHQDRIQRLAFSPNGRFLSSVSFDRTLRIWDLSTNREMMAPGKYAAPKFGHDKFYQVAYSPDGRWLATAGANQVAVVWDAETGLPIFAGSHDGTVSGVAFSQNSQQMYSVGHDGMLKIWDIPSGNLAASVKSPNERKLLNVNCNAHCDQLVMATGSRVILLMSIASHEMIELPYTERDMIVEKAKFTPDGNQLLLIGRQNVVVIRDISDTKNVVVSKIISVHTGKINDVAISNDGKWIATASQDGTFNISPFETDELLAFGCKHLGNKKLTDDECQKYLGAQECPANPCDSDPE